MRAAAARRRRRSPPRRRRRRAAAAAAFGPPPPPVTAVSRLEAERLKELRCLEREHFELLTRLPKGSRSTDHHAEEDPTEGTMATSNPIDGRAGMGGAADQPGGRAA